MNLYELSEQQADLIAQMYIHVDEDGVIADDFCDALDLTQMAIDQKLVAIQCVRLRAKAEEEMYLREIDRLQRKAKASAGLDKRLKEYVESFMLRTGQKTMQAGTFKFRLQKNAPRLIVDESAVPPDFVKIETVQKIDKEAIKDCLKKGETFSFARLEHTETLRVS
jgi:hypothetical protein